jgi:hypothetical protein
MIFYFLSRKIIKSIFQIINEFALYYHLKITNFNHLGGGSVVKAWDQEICSLCNLRFESHVVAHIRATEGLHGR